MPVCSPSPPSPGRCTGEPGRQCLQQLLLLKPSQGSGRKMARASRASVLPLGPPEPPGRAPQALHQPRKVDRAAPPFSSEGRGDLPKITQPVISLHASTLLGRTHALLPSLRSGWGAETQRKFSQRQCHPSEAQRMRLDHSLKEELSSSSLPSPMSFGNGGGCRRNRGGSEAELPKVQTQSAAG